jgi:hypothetical protein
VTATRASRPTEPEVKQETGALVVLPQVSVDEKMLTTTKAMVRESFLKHHQLDVLYKLKFCQPPISYG